MNESEIIEKITRVEAATQSNAQRLDKLEPIVGELHAMAQTLTKLVTELKHVSDNVLELKEKVDVLESIPSEKWGYASKALLTSIVGAVGAALGGAVVYVLSRI